jgi:hypothetical protein
VIGLIIKHAIHQPPGCSPVFYSIFFPLKPCRNFRKSYIEFIKMASVRKIRVGIVGLGASGSNWAARAHLPYLKSSPKYEIVALQNSTAERAVKAIAAFDLDSKKVKAYGTPEGEQNYGNASSLPYFRERCLLCLTQNSQTTPMLI